MATKVAKKYSLFQRSVRLTQTSLRSFDAWLMDRMPGIPNPPDIAEQLRQPTFVDLWEYTFAEHRQHFRDAWREYKASFDDADEAEIEKSKQEFRDAAARLRGQATTNATKNVAAIEEKLEGTQVLANIKEIQSTAGANVNFLKDEFKKVQAEVDPDAVIANVKSVVEEHRSKKDVMSTLTSNVEELMDLAKTGRDAALELEAKDMDVIKESAQSWFADKLMVAQSVLVAFIDGYKEGKTMEVEREDPILLTYAKQAAEEQSVRLKQQLEVFMAAQKEKQQRERDLQEARAKSETAEGSSDAERINETEVNSHATASRGISEADSKQQPSASADRSRE